ncbi:MAG TPA: hypothetical protein VNO21_06015 [Polyangiaceae bacterium]|nr:hypothetical protein [Polyangiaceae bacterium]
MTFTFALTVPAFALAVPFTFALAVPAFALTVPFTFALAVPFALAFAVSLAFATLFAAPDVLFDLVIGEVFGRFTEICVRDTLGAVLCQVAKDLTDGRFGKFLDDVLYAPFDAEAQILWYPAGKSGKNAIRYGLTESFGDKFTGAFARPLEGIFDEPDFEEPLEVRVQKDVGRHEDEAPEHVGKTHPSIDGIGRLEGFRHRPCARRTADELIRRSEEHCRDNHDDRGALVLFKVRFDRERSPYRLRTSECDDYGDQSEVRDHGHDGWWHW